MAKRSRVTNAIDRADVEHFDKTRSQMRQLADDIETLSKKAPDSPVSKFKLNFINEKLREANRFLSDQFKPIDGFDEFDDVSLPSNSDVVMVVRQYLNCLEQWRSAHVRLERENEYRTRWIWNVTGETLKADPPTRASHREEDDDE